MKIYTRTGDSGDTRLFAGERISKGHARLHAYGTVDELNTILGLVVASGVDELLQMALERVQSELFSIGADLATPMDAKSKAIGRVSVELAVQLENEIDEWDIDSTFTMNSSNSDYKCYGITILRTTRNPAFRP